MTWLLAAATLTPDAGTAADWKTHWPGYVLEYGLGAAGLVVLVLAWRNRQRWLQATAPKWQGTPLDMAGFVALVCVAYVVATSIALWVMRHGNINSEGARTTITVLVVEGAFLSAIAIYHFGYQKLRLNEAWPPVARLAPLVFLASVPLVLLLMDAWGGLLELCGHPVTAQATVDSFRALDTWTYRSVFILFAAVLAPFTEEIIFRGVIFRGLKQVLPRWAAVLISATLFGAAHADLSSLVPLIALGTLFAFAYDATGCIAVTMVAHGLFNLNTIVALLLGVGS